MDGALVKVAEDVHAASNAPHQQHPAPTFVITTKESQDAASVHWVFVVYQVSTGPEAQGPLALAAQAAENLSTRGFRLDLEPRRVLLPTSEEHAGPLPLPPHCALGPCREGAVVLMCV